MKIIKKLVILMLILAVIGGIAFYALFANLDAVVKEGVQQTLSYILEVDVSVGAVELSLKEQQVGISDLVIANPPGFSSAPAVSVAQAMLRIDAASFQQDVPRIRVLSITAPKILVEVNKGEGVQVSNNLKTLIDSANRFSEGDTTSSGSESSEESDGASKLIIIDSVRMENSAVRVASNLVQEDIEFSIPQVEVAEIGTAEGGIPASEAVGQILTEILKAAMTSGEVKLPLDPSQLLGESGVGDKVDAVREKVESKIGGVVKGLFGEKKD